MVCDKRSDANVHSPLPFGKLFLSLVSGSQGEELNYESGLIK